VCLLIAAPARAHPAGTASINRLLDFEYVGGGRFRVAYVLDFAEGPAVAEIEALDANRDGAVTPEEQRAYLDRRLPPLVDGWVVELDGHRVRPTIVASHVEVSPGQGGLETLRIDCEVQVVGPPPRPGRALRLHVRDEAFADLPGWREMRAGEMVDGGLSIVSPDGGDARRTSDATFTLHAEPGAPLAPPSEGLSRGLVVAVAGAAAALGVWLAARYRGLRQRR
jgi:hypothetical protein